MTTTIQQAAEQLTTEAFLEEIAHLRNKVDNLTDQLKATRRKSTRRKWHLGRMNERLAVEKATSTHLAQRVKVLVSMLSSRADDIAELQRARLEGADGVERERQRQDRENRITSQRNELRRLNRAYRELKDRYTIEHSELGYYSQVALNQQATITSYAKDVIQLEKKLAERKGRFSWR